MTASIEQKPVTQTKSSSRRALLAGALGGIGAVAAGAVAKVNPVRAEGEAIVVGGEYTTATSPTLLRNQANSTTVLGGESTSGGIGVQGVSSSNYGVYGYSTSHTGVYGGSGSHIGVFGGSSSHIGVQGSSTSDVGVRGYSTTSAGLVGSSGAVAAAKPKTGVYGYADQDAGSRGVWGYSSKGQGVRGQATSGVGLYGRAWGTGHALLTHGRIKAEQISGVATIPAGSTGVTINPGVRVNAGSFVLLTPKANIGSRGLWFTTNTGANTFRIRMSSSRSANTKVAWLLLG